MDMLKLRNIHKEKVGCFSSAEQTGLILYFHEEVTHYI